MMKTTRKMLIIEDEQDISRIIKDYLLKHGLEAAIARNGRDGLSMLEMLQPDFIILDLTLPDMDGIDLCRQIREHSSVPILILSARSSDTDKVLGLGFGADDYMTKPFSLSELLARINAYFRRYELMTATPQPADHVLRFGALTIDRKAFQATVSGKKVAMSAKEFELLYHLASHSNQVFSKTQLLDAIWGYSSYGDENTITVYIRRIREKIEADPANPSYIRTVWGVGYKFSMD